MAYDARGNFVRIHNWEQDRLNNIEIASDRHDEEDDNFAAGLSACLLRDGRAAMTGNLNLDGYRITGVGTGTASTDAVNKAQLNTKQNTVTGGASTITSSNLTASRALASNSSGKVAVSSVTATELGYLSGVTSAIQTQLNNRLTASAGDDWVKLSNGLIIQWGRVTGGASTTPSITFPKAFTSATSFSFVSAPYNASNTNASTEHVKSYSKTGVTLFSGPNWNPIFWMAIGK